MSESKRIFHTVVGHGSTLHSAVIRAGLDAAKNGFDGYVIDCEICGIPVHEHGDPKHQEAVRKGHWPKAAG